MAKIKHLPTDQQAEWLTENHKKFKNEILGERLKIPTWKVSIWLKHLGIKKLIKVQGSKRKVRKNQEKFENTNRKWLSAEYSNCTRDQHIDRILSLNTQNYANYGTNI